MSLRCSLTGHDWGERSVETHRDESGERVAVTEREYETCERCGERRLVSENTEVRAVDDGEDDEQSSTFAPSDEFETEETEDAAIIDEGPGDSDRGTRAEEVTGDEGTDEVRDAVREATGTEVTHTETPDEGDDYACPECGFSSSDGSLRDGDICPECGGYLEEA